MLQKTVHRKQKSGRDGAQAVSISRRAFLKKSVKVAGITIGAGTVLSGISAGTLYAALVKSASNLPENNRNGLVLLISKPETDMEKFGFNFIDFYTARIELAFGFKAKHIIHGATSRDFFDMVNDSQIQNMAVMGHGTHLSWIASDEEVIWDDCVEAYNQKKVDKKGWFLKHTCAHFDSPESVRLLDFPKKEVIDLDERMKKIDEGLNKELRTTISTYKDPELEIYIEKRSTGERIPMEDLPQSIREQIHKLNQEISEAYKNPDNLMRPVFGAPFFKPEKICYWLRATNPMDFLTNPFATKSFLDGFLSRFHRGHRK
jgi:hypothetical protein